MSFQVYVGNYPTEFTKYDVENIFTDFRMKLVRFIVKDRKRYSFFSCEDMNEVVSVVREKNNAPVGGRKLIVRASDNNLQSYVNMLLEEQGSTSGGSPSGAFQVMGNQSHSASRRYNEYQYETILYNSHNPSCDTYENDSSVIAHHNGKYSPSPEKLDAKKSFSDYYVGAWVSVTNFPIGTQPHELRNLFIDYNPIHIHMICNYARKDKALTEAHVCFNNQDVANDVILNFDNTIYHGRLLLVNDIEDLTILNELLDVSK